MASSHDTADADPLGPLMESVLARLRRGERPTVEEYAARYPELAADIREAFSALLMMEEVGDAPPDDSGTPSSGGRAGSGATAASGWDWEQQLGDYRIVRLVGRGGMGAVYEAEQLSLHRRVALKVLPPELTGDPRRLLRFEREARAAGRLHHTNIVPVFGMGHHGGVHFYIMQLIRGRGLDTVLDAVRRARQGGPPPAPARDLPSTATASPFITPGAALAASLRAVTFRTGAPAGQASDRVNDPGPSPLVPSDEAGTPEPVSSLGGQGVAYWDGVARIGLQVAEALAYAHAQGVLHRDIKPANLLLDPHGTVWVTDFGLAKVAEEEALSQTHDVVGTIRYMAPERFEGRADVCSDVYALGLTLYELLALRPAFEARDVRTLVRQVTETEPAPLRQVDPRIPRDLATVVHTACAHEPGRRYASAAELADDLRNVLRRMPVRARRTSWLDRFLLWCRRNPRLAASNIAAATLTAALAVGGLTAAWTFYQQRGQLATASSRYQELNKEARGRLFDALFDRARVGRLSHRVGQRWATLDALRQAADLGRELKLPPARFDSLRDEAVAALALPDVRPAGRRLPPPAPGVVCRAFDSVLARYAERLGGGDVVVRRLADDRELLRLPGRGEGEPAVFEFSPDGRFLASTNGPGPGLTVWDLDREGAAVVEDPGPVRGAAAGFRPDSRRLLLVRADGDVMVHELGSRRVVRAWNVRRDAGHVAYDPGGTRVAVAGFREGTGQAACEVFDAETGRSLTLLELPAGCGRVAWSPDGSTLATPCGDRAVYLWDVDTGTRRATLKGLTRGEGLVGFHPSGALLAGNDASGTLRLWEPQLGRPVLELTGRGGTRFSADGRTVVEGVDGAAVWKIDPAREYRTLAHAFPRPTPYHEAAVHPQGRLLAVGTDEGLALWDLAYGTELRLLGPGPITGVRFDSSGDLVISGFGGVNRRTVTIDLETGAVRLGPPQALITRSTWSRHRMDRAGRVVALPEGSEVVVSTPDRVAKLRVRGEVRDAAVSPDGRWLVTAGGGGSGLVVWRLDDGSREAELPVGGPATAFFSPDVGRWLATNGGPCRLWQTATWTAAREVGGVGLAFTPDGGSLLVQDPDNVLRLVECDTGRTLARLEGPDLARADAATFGPDGATLVLVTGDGPAVRVWDLRAVRGYLASNKLDWGNPPGQAPGAPPGARLTLVEPPPTPVIALGARRPDHDDPNTPWQAHRDRALTDARNGRWSDADAELDAAIRKGSTEPWCWWARALLRLHLGDRDGYRRVCADLFDRFGANPGPKSAGLVVGAFNLGPDALADPTRALRLAERLAAERPHDHDTLNTLGVALYRAGRFGEAVACLDRAVAATDDRQGDVWDWVFLAMAHERLGHRNEARAWLDRVTRRTERAEGSKLTWNQRVALALFRREAESTAAAGDAPALRPAPGPETRAAPPP